MIEAPHDYPFHFSEKLILGGSLRIPPKILKFIYKRRNAARLMKTLVLISFLVLIQVDIINKY